MPKIIIFLCLLTSAFLFGQHYPAQENKVSLGIGAELRAVPFGYPSRTNFYTFPQKNYIDIDAQNSGPAVHFSVQYALDKRWRVGGEISLRYDVVMGYFGRKSNRTPNELFDIRPVRSLITDYHLYVDYYVKSWKKSDVYLRLGKSFMNRGTRIYVHHEGGTFYELPNGASRQLEGPIIGFYDTQYDPWNLALVLTKKRVDYSFGFYSILRPKFYDYSFILPYINIRYRLGKQKKL